MTNPDIFQQVLSQISRIRTICSQKDWNLKQDLIIDRAATIEEVNKIENQLGFKLPPDYKELFLTFAKRLDFSYQFDKRHPDEFNGIFSGEISWDLDALPEMHEQYLLWVEASLMPEYNDPEAIEITRQNWMQKVPLLSVPNGDLILIGDAPSEVMYFSHEGDKMHGKILGSSLFEFLEFHSRVGFIGSEDWQFEPFFNYQENKMETIGPKVDRFIKWHFED